jgi:hypothetical protein
VKKVYSSEHSIMAGHVKSLLENSGIECIDKNQFLSGGKGELPINECWPEVWVTNDADHDRAMEIVNAIINDNQAPAAAWQCNCGEKIEGQFSACWNCGIDRPD